MMYVYVYFPGLCRSREAGLAHHASSHECSTPTTTDRIHDISPAPPRPLAVARACPDPTLELSTHYSDGPADHSSEASAVSPTVDPSLALPEHGPCFVGGTITLDDASFTTKIAIHSGAGVLAPTWRFLTLAPHRLSSDEMFRIACTRLVRHPSRVSRNAPVLGGGLANRPP